ATALATMACAWAGVPRFCLCSSARAGVDVPSRFARSRSVVAHFGFAPRQWQSGEVDRTGSISCGDAMMRAALYEAANVLLGARRGGRG
ncbi:MAG: transposase, partial [Deltaproteobacteria bacterium]|nr:transposase [Deltaproteobacteria bacterium]